MRPRFSHHKFRRVYEQERSVPRRSPPPPPPHQISASISFFFLSESAWERRPPSSKRFSVFSRSSMDPFVADAEEGAVELEPPTFRFFGLASPEFAGAFVFVALGFAGA
eukprot:scaffold72094_cov63-Phaeocystis_antarctica.AAC.2